MATAEVFYKDPQPVEKVVLTLTDDEATVLAAVLGRVGGDSIYSRRKFTEQISNALYTANYTTKINDDLSGGLTFL